MIQVLIFYLKVLLDQDNLRFHILHVGTTCISSRYSNNLLTIHHIRFGLIVDVYFISQMCFFHFADVFIKSHNKKVTNAENKQTKHCNCRKKQECPLEGKCRSEDIIYKCVVTATGHPRKAYLGTAGGDFKQRYYNHKKSFRNRKYANGTSFSKYILKNER